MEVLAGSVECPPSILGAHGKWLLDIDQPGMKELEEKSQATKNPHYAGFLCRFG